MTLMPTTLLVAALIGTIAVAFGILIWSDDP